MLLRCSVCKGQFEVDPDMKKPTVFCSHCGAQLQTAKPGRRRAPNTSAAVGALSGEQLPIAPEITAPIEEPLGGFVEEFEAPPVEQRSAPVQPVSSGDFGNFGAPSDFPSQQYGIAPRSGPASSGGPRRQMRRKKDNGILIVSLVVGGVILAIAVTLLVVWLNSGTKETPKPPANDSDAGELFKNVKPTR